jgi:hypothetical protein
MLRHTDAGTFPGTTTSNLSMPAIAAAAGVPGACVILMGFFSCLAGNMLARDTFAISVLTFPGLLGHNTRLNKYVAGDERSPDRRSEQPHPAAQCIIRAALSKERLLHGQLCR